MIKIAPMGPEHWEEVRRIHLEGIATGEATFETDSAPDWAAWAEEHLGYGRLVAIEDGAVLGWAALTPVSDRCVYAGVAEVSVYVGADARGRGVGSQLLAGLIDESEKNGIWTLQAGIFSGNDRSIRLHEKHGFRVIGRRERLGKLAGRWQDVMLLERRSDRVGVD
ncbi:MAG TPA: GNAT family N-acetyltransferase [Gemmatimonadota bacterium]|nr:GNAT family N-acetyltransferase [Gemmatimonadota bacterium]